MNDSHILTIATQNGLRPEQVQAVADLLQEGGTVPFIARYRKEATGSLDEVVITDIRDSLIRLKELDERKQTILKSLEQHGHLNDELREKVLAAETMAVLEDIYLPYKPKRRTKATIAREKGLEPLALAIFEQKGITVATEAQGYIDPEKGVADVEEALSGARDIIAEMINENEQVRNKLRVLYSSESVIISKVVKAKEEEGAKYRDYFDWQEPLATVPSHRILAMRRGEKEDILNVTIAPDEDAALKRIEDIVLTGDGEDAEHVTLAIKDCYKRLLSRSMETEMRVLSKEKADAEAIKVFTENLRQLLLSPPLGAKRTMGLDPGFRTGCKLVCLDQQGKLLHNDTIYPHGSDHQNEQSRQKVLELCQRFEIEAIAVGNGTAGRETEAFIRALPLPAQMQVVMVNESGASIYSASEIAREEFPNHDVTVRGAVSIGRRLMDPLAELVKIDPKSIGVGQYQHDVDQAALRASLDDVVVSCVNGVGVDVNQASAQLLTYVSGLGPQIAKNIIAYRDENGPFSTRKQLKKVPRLGPKAFEQCAGFLRIRNGENRLDGSAVHPESYHIVDAMAGDLECSVDDLISDSDKRSRIDISRYVSEKIGLPTLKDIVDELAKPGRDPREEFEAFAFASGIEKISDLREGMTLPGIVTNITKFGAFVDVGVHQDGLVHVSEMADRFIKDPSEIVKIHQKVSVSVLEVDIARNRISLSMKKQRDAKPAGKVKKGGKAALSHSPSKKAQKKPGGKPKAVPFNNPFADFFNK